MAKKIAKRDADLQPNATHDPKRQTFLKEERWQFELRERPKPDDAKRAHEFISADVQLSNLPIAVTDSGGSCITSILQE